MQYEPGWREKWKLVLEAHHIVRFADWGRKLVLSKAKFCKDPPLPMHSNVSSICWRTEIWVALRKSLLHWENMPQTVSLHWTGVFFSQISAGYVFSQIRGNVHCQKMCPPRQAESYCWSLSVGRSSKLAGTGSHPAELLSLLSTLCKLETNTRINKYKKTHLQKYTNAKIHWLSLTLSVSLRSHSCQVVKLGFAETLISFV